MKKIKLLTATLTALAMAAPLFGEFVFLRDGSIIEGTVVKDEAASILLRDSEKKTRRIQRNEIMRILYTELNMGKIYVQKRDGKGITAFMVDEDRTTYTFRKELYDPAEFTLKRADVLFIAERNPSGLKGEAETDRVNLEWFPSYDPMKRYKIYIKKKGEGYVLADTSRKNSCTLTGLASNTGYMARVTGVDRENAETTPSNEFTFLTKNVPPRRPGNVAKKAEPTAGPSVLPGMGRRYRRQGDPDTASMPRLKASGPGSGRPGRPSTSSRTRRAKKASRWWPWTIGAMNRRPAGIRLVEGVYAIFVSPGVFLPMGNLADMGSMGYGATLSVEKRDFFFLNLEIGIEAGFYFLPGVNDLKTEYQKTERVFFVPLSLYCGYSFAVSESFYTVPYLSAGGAYYDMPYVQRDVIFLTDEDEHLKTFGPIGGAGISLSWRRVETFELGLKGLLRAFT